MAFRIASKRLMSQVPASARLPGVSGSGRRFAQTVAKAQETSNLPEGQKEEVFSAAGLTHPDPAPDSQTAALLAEQAPFMVRTYTRPTPMFSKGLGSYLYDIENRKYLDFTSGIAVNALGHCDAEVVKLLSQQANQLMHTSNLYHNPWTGALSQLLVEKTLASGAMHGARAVFICNSGSEANEAAIKFARKAGKMTDPSGAKHEIVSFHGCFHGRTMGSLSATPNPKYQAPFAPMVPGFKYGNYNKIDEIEGLVNEKTAAVIVEPIQGEGGVVVAQDDFLIALAQRCKAVGALLIYDEIQCGLGRTGQLWAHGHLPAEAHPDILTTAKALGNGFPIGATMVSGEVAEKMAVGDHGTTFGGNPLGARVAHHIVSRLADPVIHEDVKVKSDLFLSHFRTLQESFPELVKEIRGKGLLLGLQLTRDPAPIVKAARERGLLVITAGTNTLRFVPPLTILAGEIEEGMETLAEAMRAVVEGRP